jgi:hypothetical protein
VSEGNGEREKSVMRRWTEGEQQKSEEVKKRPGSCRSHFAHIYLGHWKVLANKDHNLSANIVQASLVKHPEAGEILKVLCASSPQIILVPVTQQSASIM